MVEGTPRILRLTSPDMAAMPLLFEQPDGLGVFAARGDVDFQTGLQVLTDGLADVATTDPRRRVLFDLTETTENRSAQELRAIAGAISRGLPGARLAILVARDLAFGLSRMFAVFAEFEGLVAGVFRDREEALAFLASDGSAVSPAAAE